MVLCAGCGHKAPPPAPPPPKVSVVTVQAQAVPITTELPGRVTGYRTADVRPQVNGIILKRLFVEGSDVKAGQQLYQIDPAPYQASYDSAVAAACFRPGTRGALQAAGRSKCRQQAGLRQRRGLAPAGAGGGGNGAHQSDLHPSPVSDHGPHRPLVDHGRGAGHRQSSHRARHRPTARPGVRGRDPTHHDPAALEEGGRRGAAQAKRGGEGPGAAAAGRWQRLRPPRHAGVLRGDGGSGHGLGHAARADAQSRASTPAGHVRARRDPGRRAPGCRAGTATGHQPRSEGRAHCARGGSGQYRRAADPQDRSRHRRSMVGDFGAQARGPRHRRGDPVGEARREGGARGVPAAG